MTSTSTPFPVSRRQVFAWALYDWAVSAHSTLTITFVLNYMLALFPKHGATVYAFAFGFSMLAAALLSPVVGALADANRSKRRWLAGTALVGAAAAIVMAVLPVGYAWVTVAAFVVMCTMADLSFVPYNGFLTEISDEGTVNRASAYGFALGYLGGSLPLLAALLLSMWGERSGMLDIAAQHRAGLWMLGLWWGVFTLPVVLILRDRGEAPERRRPLSAAVRGAFREVGQTLRGVRRFRVLALFLLAFLLYNDGIATVYTQANVLAKKTFGFDLFQMCWLVLVIQWVALPAALVVGWISDCVGQKATIMGCLAVWIGVSLGAMLITTQTQFWILGIAVALVLGGTQSVSRAAMGSMTPPSRSAEFFGFFNVSGKAAAFLGPVTFGAIMHLTDNPQWAIAALAVFFIGGGLIVARLDFAAGRRDALEAERREGPSSP
jgi:UMF1 family MFS transporter